MKKAIHSFLLILALTLLPMAFASAVEMPPANEISSDPSFSFVEWFNPLRSGDYSFTYVSSGIKGGDGYVYVTGETETNIQVACIGGVGVIQQWKDNKWNSYKRFSFDKFDASSSSFERTFTVDRGYHYRLYVSHSAEDMDGAIDKVTITKSVLVK